MHRLVRSIESLTFLTPGGDWTEHVQDAAHFPSRASVMEAVDSSRIDDLQLYYLLQDIPSEEDFTVSLSAASPADEDKFEDLVRAVREQRQELINMRRELETIAGKFIRNNQPDGPSPQPLRRRL